MARGRMRHQDASRIQRNYNFLLENVEAKLLSRSLLEVLVLSYDDMDEVTNKVECVNNTEGMALLLNRLLRGGDDAYEHFIKCLRKANYSGVVSKLEETNSPSGDVNNTLNNIQDQLKNVTNAQTEYQESVQSVKEKVVMYETKLKECQGKQQKTHKDIILIKEQVAENKGKTDTHDEEIKSVKEMVKAYGVKLEGCQRTSQSQTEVMKSLEAQIQPIKTAAALVPALQVKQEQMNIKVTTLETFMVDCQKTSQSQTENVESLEERIGSLETAIALSNTDVQQELQSTTALITDIKDKIDEVLSTLESEKKMCQDQPRQPEELVKSVHNTNLAESMEQSNTTSVERVLGNFMSTIEVKLSCGQPLSPEYGTPVKVNNSDVDMQTKESSLQGRDPVQGEVLNNYRMTVEATPSLEGSAQYIGKSVDVGIQTTDMPVPDGNIQVSEKAEQETPTFDDLSSQTFVKYPEAIRSRGCTDVDSPDGVAGTDLKLQIFKAVNNQKVANGFANVGSGEMKLVELEKFIANQQNEDQMVMITSITSFDGHEIYSYRQKHKNMSLKSLGVQNGDSINYECVR